MKDVISLLNPTRTGVQIVIMCFIDANYFIFMRVCVCVRFRPVF